MSQNICAYPYKNYQNDTQVDFESKKGRRIERYASNYEDSNASFKILSRNQEKESMNSKQLYINNAFVVSLRNNMFK